ncbi:MAG: aminoglycoside phosphotransferase family protein [Alphaproteobacteria bacterium]
MMHDAAQLAVNLATHMLGAPPDRVEPGGSGGNNRLWKVIAGSDTFALKTYPRQAADPRDRVGAEYAALSFLTRNGILDVPRPLAVDVAAGCALYQWIDGVRLTAPSRDDVDALVGFLYRVQWLRDAEGADGLAPASAACPSAAAAVNQAEQRLNRLKDVMGAPELAAFIAHDLEPTLEAVATHAWEGYDAAGLSFDADLERADQWLSPSDFGFHNVLKRPNGSLAFLDFEYFGWDDPVKAVADVILHPGMNLDTASAHRFFDGAGTIIDPERWEHFQVRFRFLYPLYVVIWSMIMLNEFLPERWERRVLAGGVDTHAAATARQLARARAMLSRVTGGENDCGIAFA